MLDLETLRPILRATWTADTCDPHDLPDWRPDNPARGQCGVTALIVQDHLGGDLILGEVLAHGTKVGHHYWNRLPDGRHVDLTADQFRPEEVIVGGQTQHRPPGAPRRCREQYDMLIQRVLTDLGDRTDTGRDR
ncbi:YunG family protein [Micromonospora sp. SH-82]|uniref:YunG family protein n=1 Tax=Micromonospora sp. SH-82 TaxID=3132938 RepID=UPI003EBBAB5D